MAEVRLKYGVLFASRRVRASATVSICLAIGSPSETVRPAAARHDPDTAVVDHPELRARWHALPKSVRPQDWVTGTGSRHVPGSLLIAEAQRPPEGYYPASA
ncbi:MAG: hypothetical protein LC644_05395 [Pseudonocardia sp.]|jgi:hypothetical protein|nr:hypothetical protein [Pseudonocardia sp.]